MHITSMQYYLELTVTPQPFSRVKQEYAGIKCFEIVFLELYG